MKVAWLTDIHLNFLGSQEEGLQARKAFLESVSSQGDAVLLTGDIGESDSILTLLEEMEQTWKKPILFVLGNHDFYRSSVDEVRRKVAEATSRSPRLRYLTAQEVVELTPRTAVVGHDGWPDGREGDLIHSTVLVSDLIMVRELSRWCELRKNGMFFIDKFGVADTLAELSEDAAKHFENVLSAAADSYPEVLLLTHVPPFREAAWYRGRVSDNHYLPYFASRVAGETIRKVMSKYPKTRLLVLCGHTHGSGRLKVSENIEVWTGGARYGQPQVQCLLELPNWKATFLNASETATRTV